MQRIKKLVFIVLYCQCTVWSQLVYSFGSTGSEYGKASTVDFDTNYICAALFAQSINVNPAGMSNLTSNGLIDVALIKLSKRGELVFGRRFGGVTTTDAPHAVETDSANNIYVAGYFGINGNPTPQNADFNPDGGGTLRSKGGLDAFLAKYDRFGNFLWAISLGNSLGNTEERAWDIAVEKTGNVYLSGGFHGSVDFNPLGSPNIQSLPDGNAGLFLAKYDGNGINQWVVPIAANDTSVFSEAYTAIDLNANDRIIFSGNFRGANVNFNPSGTTALSSAGQTDIFFACYTTSGNLEWVKRVGGTSQDIISPGALRVDPSNNIFFTGRIAGTVDFDPDTGITSVTGASLFLASYTQTGSLRFAFGMPSNPGDGGHRIAFDKDQNVYVSGWMNGTVNFNPSGSANLTANSSTADVFLAKYSNAGAYVWAHNFGAANATDQNIAAGLSVDQQDNVYITGQFSGTNADFDPGTRQILLSSNGGNDCFIAKYTKDGAVWVTPTGINEKHSTEKYFSVLQNYPNPFNPSTTIAYTLTNKQHVTLQIFDVLGNQLKTLVNEEKPAGQYELTFNAGNLPSGVYLCSLSADKFREVKKLVIIK